MVSGRNTVVLFIGLAQMEFVAEAEVRGGLPQADIRMREQERAHSFQPVFALELAGSLPHDGGKALEATILR